MLVLFFSPYFHPYTSGITTYPYRLFKELAKDKKYDFTVLTFHHDPTLPREEVLEGIRIVRIPYLFRISKGFISPQSLFYFWDKVGKADKVMLNIPNFEGFPLAFFSWLKGKPLFSIFHCLVYPSSNGMVERVILNVLNASIFFQLWLSLTIVGYTEDYVSQTWVGKRFEDKIEYTLPPILKPGLDPIPNLPKKMKGEVWIGFAGRVSKEKGIEYLIKAIHNLHHSDLLADSALRQSGRKRNIYKLIFAGPYGKDVAGESEYFEMIKKKLEKYGVQHTFLGNLKSEQLGTFYSTIDALVLPSVTSTEAFGMVQAEAMLCGTPVIASDLPGVRVPVQLTGMGRVVEPGNAEELTAAIHETLKEKDKSVYNNQARNVFDFDKTIGIYTRLFCS